VKYFFMTAVVNALKQRTVNAANASLPVQSATTVSSATPLLEDNERDQWENDLVDNDPLLETQSNTSSQYARSYKRLLSLLLAPVTDERGHGWAVVLGITTIFITGTVLGLIMPKNPHLPTVWYRTISSCIGYTYFISWSVSFYPQLLANYRRRTTRGLSPDFCALNVLGFACYATYNVAMYGSPYIHKLYRERYGNDAEITVQSNDVAFAVHAFLLASLTLFQIGYYDGFRSQTPSRFIGKVLLAVISLILAFPIVIYWRIWKSNWLDFVYVLSFVKIFVTMIKYVPQVILNFQRKSTAGWSIWQILLDLNGGLLSDLQLVLDATALQDFSGITGNLAKFFLGFVSIVFDAIFMVQHYALYRSDANDSGDDSGSILTSENVNDDISSGLVV